MRRILIGGAIALVALALYAAGFAALNGDAVAKARDLQVRAPNAAAAGETLELLDWNLGYGGLGAASDFVADGGAHMFPPSRAAVESNVDGIIRVLREQAASADVILFEEIAHDGPVNYWVNLKGRIDAEVLGDRNRAFFADFQTRLMPWPLRLTHGQAIYSNFAFESADVIPLPAEDTSIFGVKRRYASVVARVPIAGQANGWTIVSVHLAAFDPDAAVRTRQLRELMAWAQGEYARGQHVVLGGDWNFQIAETYFPHRTDERFLFWLFPFPQDALPEGWRIGADASVPSVRTNHQPYVAGDNYVTTIDGFIVSPNVAIESVAGINLDFEYTDHQPVRIRVRAIEEATE